MLNQEGQIFWSKSAEKVDVIKVCAKDNSKHMLVPDLGAERPSIWPFCQTDTKKALNPAIGPLRRKNASFYSAPIVNIVRFLWTAHGINVKYESEKSAKFR